MAIDIYRGLDARVAKSGLDDVDGDAGGQQEAGVGVAQIVEAHGDAAAIRNLPVTVGEAVRLQDRPVGPGAHLVEGHLPARS